MIAVEYIRVDAPDASEVEEALKAGRAVLVHQTSRYAYLKAIAPAGFGELLGRSLDEVPSGVRKYFLRKHVRRVVISALEDGTEQEEVLDLYVLPDEVQKGDEVLGEYEVAKFAGEDN